MRIPHPKQNWGTPYPPHYAIFGRTKVFFFQKLSYGSETSEGLGEMFEGNSSEMWAGKFPLMSMGGRAEGLACVDPGARNPIGVSRIDLFVQCKFCVSVHLFNLIGAQLKNPSFYVFLSAFLLQNRKVHKPSNQVCLLRCCEVASLLQNSGDEISKIQTHILIRS